MSNLGNRLFAVTKILEKIKGNELFADIGSDHAYLAIEVVKKGLAGRAIASDINELPLLKGKENASAFGVDVEFILSDGFDAFDDRHVTSAAICGMGGELIAKIIDRSKIARNCTLILQPMSAQEDLRRYLWDNGFDIVEEIFVSDFGKHYTVMQVNFTGDCSGYGYLDLYLGKERLPSPEFSSYCQKIKDSAVKRRLGIIARNESTQDIDELIDFCQAQTQTF